MHALAAPRELREAEEFLRSWCPQGVEVVNDGKACWLHYGGMIYSLEYRRRPDIDHVPFMTQHLENHKWCMALSGGVYSHRSLLEAWARRYLPGAHVIGACENDILYPDETSDRPLLKGTHTVLVVTHNKKFVMSTKTSKELACLALDLVAKTRAISEGRNIYIRGNF